VILQLPAIIEEPLLVDRSPIALLNLNLRCTASVVLNRIGNSLKKSTIFNDKFIQVMSLFPTNCPQVFTPKLSHGMLKVKRNF